MIRRAIIGVIDHAVEITDRAYVRLYRRLGLVQLARRVSELERRLAQVESDMDTLVVERPGGDRVRPRRAS